MADLTKPHPQSKCRAKVPTACRWHGHAVITTPQRTLNIAIHNGDWDVYAQLRDVQANLDHAASVAGEDGYVCHKKVQYSTSEQAQRALEKLQGNGINVKQYYYCDQHMGYHMTSYSVIPAWAKEKLAERRRAQEDQAEQAYQAAYRRLCDWAGLTPIEA